MSAHIMIVEDEADLAALISDYLIDAGYRTSVFGHGSRAYEALQAEAPDLLILDLMLPGMDGIALCKAVRSFSVLPIVMVTARVEEVDRLLGLEVGADDYVCKPFSPRELVARVKAILRRASPAQAATYLIDDARQQILIHGQVLDLTPTEFRLLATLLRRAGQVYSRAQLLDLANPEGLEVTDRAIDSHIKNLRRKLARHFPEADVIQSVYGVGYRIEIPG